MALDQRTLQIKMAKLDAANSQDKKGKIEQKNTTPKQTSNRHCWKEG